MTIKPGSPMTETSDAPERRSDVLDASDVGVRAAAKSGAQDSSTGVGVQGVPDDPTVDAGNLGTPDDPSSSPGNATASATTRAADPPAVESSAVPDDSVSERSQIADVLHRYARAYGDLNVSAAREVWPDVDHRALTRAFDSLASQTVSFDECRIDISGTVAQASCRGEASYVVKVGHNEPRTEARTWRFQLRRDGGSWKIASAEARGDAH
jgi:hypothetical protein